MYRILKGELNSPAKFKEKLLEYVEKLKVNVEAQSGFRLDTDELGELLLATCRSNDFDVIELKKSGMYLNVDKVSNWVKEKLIPNIVIIRIDDEDIIRLLIFCIEITYQMFAGGTRATVTQKGFRERRRTFESILVDQFVGKLGEIMVKKFIENTGVKNVELDWEISRQIEKYRNDILNAKKNISIKTSPALAGIWAEADMGYDYGITVKCSVPQPTILQFFIEVCGFTRLLDFAENKISSNDVRFNDYIGEMRKRIKDYKCGEIQTRLKGFICGYFKTSEYKPIKKGKDLPYLGEVREERFLVPVNKLKHSKSDWTLFLKEVGLV